MHAHAGRHRGLRSAPATRPTPSRSGSAAGVGPTSRRPSVVFSCHQVHVSVGGSAAFYSAVLSCPPDHNVTLSPSHVPTSLRVTPTLHVVGPHNWSTPQWFRVSAVSSAGEDALQRTTRGGSFLQTIEHTCTSRDPRFHGHRPLLLPAVLAVYVAPRDGAFVFASGRLVATARRVGKATATASQYGFRLIDDDSGGASPAFSALSASRRLSHATMTTARSSLVGANQPTPGNAAAMAAVAAANSAVAKRLSSSRRSLSAESGGRQIVADADLSASASASVSASVSSAFLAPTAKDVQHFVRVACRKTQTLLLHRNRSVLSLGKTSCGLDASSSASSSEDFMLSKMLTDVACGDDHVVAITEHGSLLAWGLAHDGRLGLGSDFSASASASVSAPTLLRALLHKRILQIACGARHTLAIAEDGDVFAWGFGASGALGLATSEHSRACGLESVPSPMEVLTLKHRGVAYVACGDLHSAVLLTNGTLLTCGWASHGRLGRPVKQGDDLSSCFMPVDLNGRFATYVACGGAHTLAMLNDQGVVAFGCNTSGQLGLGDVRDRWTPTLVPYFENRDDEPSPLVVTNIAAAKSHSLATTADARVFAWGSDEFGQCGVGAFPQQYTVPHLVASALGLEVTQIACGDGHSVLLGRQSPQQLEVLETTQPVRYAQLVDWYETCVHEDKTRRAQVLRVATQRLEARERTARHRKPPLDPTILRGARWQAQLQDASNQAQVLVVTASPVRCQPPSVRQTRPQTASAVLRAALMKSASRAIVRPATGGAQQTRVVGKPQEVAAVKKVRCSSATLWRQTRLFTFPPPPPEVHESPVKGDAVRQRLRHPLKLTAEARQSLGRIFHGDGDQSNQGTNELASGAIDGKSEGGAAQFSASRPKSAPARPGVTTTRAS